VHGPAAPEAGKGQSNIIHHSLLQLLQLLVDALMHARASKSDVDNRLDCIFAGEVLAICAANPRPSKNAYSNFPRAKREFGEHRLPACSSRQLAANLVSRSGVGLEILRYAKLHLASGKWLQAGSLCSPDYLLIRGNNGTGLPTNMSVLAISPHFRVCE